MRRVIWSVPTATQFVALTFDDGPHTELTVRVLDVLRAAGVRATFNMVGHAVDTDPDLARHVVAAGHEVGNHTATHLDLASEDRATTGRELREATASIERVTGRTPRWFRPPRGNVTGASMREAARLGQDVLLWSTSANARTAATADDVVAGTMRRLQPGAVVALHDGLGRGMFSRDPSKTAELVRRRRLELDALPALIEAIAGRGLRCVTVSELVAAGG